MLEKLADSRTVSTIKRLRFFFAGVFCVLIIALGVVIIPVTRGASPGSGAVSEANPLVSWTGQVLAPSGSADCGGPNNSGCDNFAVNFQAPSAAFGPYLLEIKLQPQGDWDMQVYGPNNGLLDGSGNSPNVLEIVTLINPASGNYTVTASPFAPLVGTDGNSYAASVELKHYVINSAVQGADTNISYHNFTSPAGLGNDSGEPTLGVNWNSGRAMMIAGTETLRVTFDDATIPARATWEDKSFIWTNVITMDPILFTDRSTGRTMVSQLITPAAANGLGVLSDGCSLSAVTDDDGDNWLPDEGCGPPSGADHQSIGGGPFHTPLPTELPAPAYAHATYYCAQSGVTAYCSRSDDGGLTYGPGVPIYTSECSGLHGHPMVGSDGTVYVPNRSCGGKQGVVVSEDNGVTWNVRTVPDSLQGANDPGVAIGANGTVYFGYQNGDGLAEVAVSHDKGLNWAQSKNIGAPYEIHNSAFPRVVAGDDDRAAFAFLGTPTGGPFQSADFQGEWHLYVAHTFDSGQTWTTIDATPTDPVQRGCIWMQGGSNPCRNLLDFMGQAVDKEGRVLVGYADGCLNCSSSSTSHSKKATIARQVNGRRLFAAYDPASDPSPTPTPSVSPTPAPSPGTVGPTLLHFHGNPDDSGAGAPCTGSAPADVAGCGGPFLKSSETLFAGPPAIWHATSAVNQNIERSTVDPNWIWNLGGAQTTLRGDLVLNWWGSCGVCVPGTFEAEWDVSIWADGVQRFTQHIVGPTPATPNVPSLLSTTINLPENITATDHFVLVIDPAFLDTQANTKFFYDSTLPCPGGTAGPCDSTVTMPVVDPNQATPTPTPTSTPTPNASPTPTPGPVPPGTPQYLNYYPPSGVADSWGEPSIGVNWLSGKVMFFGGLNNYALRVSFNDSTSPAATTWDQTPLLSNTLPRIIGGDPILVTDKDTGRTFVSQLQGLTPSATMDVTDDDGASYIPSAGFGIATGLDHQTIGVGPYHAPLPPGVVYQNAVYYCAQEGLNVSQTGAANCALSVDGGLTFGPAVPVYAFTALNGCGPLHGHAKIAPDGTVYLPNRKCGNGAGMVVSADNGITWQVRTVPDSSSGDTDASVGIATDGTVFLGYEAADGHARIAVSHDKGVTWSNHTDVGAQLGLQNSVFPAVVAGDGGDNARAAFAFYGSTSPGDTDDPTFSGVWYLYISSTFDGGRTWTTVNATPNDPMQRDGICTRGFQGCAVPRNLLDFFDATVDKEGRVLVGYEDGCMGACVQGGPNSNTEKGVIARQSGGQRMFAAFDQNPTPTPTPSASPTVTPTPTATPTPNPGILPAPQDAGPKVGFQNYEAPSTLVNVNSSSQGPSALTVEYLGHDAGEPSVGNNWRTNVLSYQSDLQTLFLTFNDSCPANGQAATWVNRPAPTSKFVDSDPIGFTDRYTGRTFAGELTLTSPTCKTSFTDDDGQTWTVSQGSGLAASVDHETIGGGPFHAPLTRPTNVPGLYPDAVYYCSQLPHSSCARSDDGGLTFGPAVPVDPVADAHCGGLHGHVKVAPDGTVYLPFNYCDGQGATIVSQDNGITWTIRHVTNTTTGQSDPAVGVDNNGRAYFVMASATGDGSQAVVATTDNAGQTWQNVYDVGASYGLKNIAFPAAVAADAGRAAVAFYGTTTPGNLSANGFRGLWHLYIAETFDGGAHWTTSDATPNAPLQRGCIWTGGGANICRNLLDFFDITVDREGRVEVGYVNGCAGGHCAQAAPTATGNAYTATAVIARQSSGRRLVAAYDPPNAMSAASVPGMPSVTTRRVGNVVHLGWSEADTGNSPITSYKIMRGTASGNETLLTTVAGTATGYDDANATDTTKTYYYKVLAVNAMGTSCGANEVVAPYVGDTCGGLILQRLDPTHPESILAQQNPALAIDYIAAGEPPATNNLMFRLKVSTLASVPANSRWRVVWNSESAPGQQWFVGMRSDASSRVTFEYGSIATQVVGLVIGVPTETVVGTINGSFNADGTITLFVPKSAVGNPQPGDLLGAVNGRTFTGDTPQTGNLERSTLLIDHTFVKAQRDNGAPAATYTVVGNTICSAFIEQNVNSLVSLQASNPGTAIGASSFDLAIKNTSTQSIFVPLRSEVAQLTSATGNVTVKNADNGGTRVGASWDYSANVGSDSILTASELSLARTLRFNNPNNEPFTATFNVIGNLANPGNSSSTSGGGSSGGSGGSGGGNPAYNPAGGVTGLVFQVTYNPLLNTIKVKVLP